MKNAWIKFMDWIDPKKEMAETLMWLFLGFLFVAILANATRHMSFEDTGCGPSVAQCN